MARTTKGSNRTTQAANARIKAAAARQQGPEDEALPDGFEEVMGARVRGWFDRVAGNVLQGRLLEIFRTKSKFSRDDDGKKNVFKIEVTKGAPQILVVGEGDEETTIKAAVGDVVGIDESGWLKRLGSVELGREVYIKCLGKDEPSEEYPQGAWKYKVGVNTTERVDLRTGEVNQTNGAGHVGRDL